MAVQSSNTILMIEPVAFAYNAETAVNNFFQKHDDVPADQIQQHALNEFKALVKLLENKGIRVVVEKDTPEPHTPDSIFPNNWISFQEDNRVALYPMFAANRRLERRLDIIQKLEEYGFHISQMVDYSVYEKENKFLEGTGSMVFDRKNRIAYAALSERTNETLFSWFCADFGYRPVSFSALQTVENERMKVYHTNVMMCVADQYAVVCLKSIDNKQEREAVKQSLIGTGKEIIEITEKQMHCFAGNMIQVKNTDGNLFLVMSRSAYDSLDNVQLNKLQKYNELIVTAIPTIEKYGGGSVRCMMAEVF